MELQSEKDGKSPREGDVPYDGIISTNLVEFGNDGRFVSYISGMLEKEGSR